MNTNMQAIWVNRGLNLVMWLAGGVEGLNLAHQLPPALVPWVPLISLLGIGAAKASKTPSQAIAAAVPPSKGPPLPPATPMLLLLLLAGFANCDAPSDVATSEAAVTTGACSGPPGHLPSRAVDVHFNGGACVRYQMPYSDPIWTQYHYDAIATGLGVVASVETGQGAAAWVCDVEAPDGFASTPYAPCWTSGRNGDGAFRIRGFINQYGVPTATSATITSVSGRSFVISPGYLTGPPACSDNETIPFALNEHRCTDPISDSGQYNWRANNDPSDSSNCCNVSGVWPDGTHGAPCLGYGGDGNYATIHYDCF
jgi:hypothetical protein